MEGVAVLVKEEVFDRTSVSAEVEIAAVADHTVGQDIH